MITTYLRICIIHPNKLKIGFRACSWGASTTYASYHVQSNEGFIDFKISIKITKIHVHKGFYKSIKKKHASL